MSDVVTETAAPAPAIEPAPTATLEAPAEEPVEEQQVAEPVTSTEKPQPVSRREARRGLRRGGTPPAPAPEPVAAEPAGEAPVAEAPAPAAAVAPEGPAQPDPIMVDVPDYHPVREMGLKAFKATSDLEARGIRALLNSYTRRAELAEMQKQLSTRDKELAEVQRELATVQSQQAAQTQFRATPEYSLHQQRYQELKDAYGEEVANNYMEGVQRKLNELAAKEFEQRWGQVEADRFQRAAQQFANTAWQHTNGLPEPIRQLPEFGQYFQQALEGFNDAIARGHVRDVKPGDQEGLLKAFTAFFSTHLLRQPNVVAAFNRMDEQKRQQEKAAVDQAAAKQRELDAIKKQAVEEHMKSLAAKRQGSPPNPLGNLQSATRARVPDGQTDESELKPSSPGQLRRMVRQQVREDTRRRFGG